MTRLCQITALLTGKKTAVTNALTGIYHRFQKPALFYGLTKRYSSSSEDGETFPDEVQNIQQYVQQCLDEVRDITIGMIDLVATQDKANCLARAPVVVDGKTIIDDVPVTHLLFLEKALVDLHTAFGSIPILDPQEKWNFAPNSACFVSESSETNKTKKVPRTHIKYEATPQHPAQTEMYHEDVVIGRWKTIKFSAAIPAQDKKELLARIMKLRDAVKLAREEANSIEVNDVKHGEAIFGYIFDKS